MWKVSYYWHGVEAVTFYTFKLCWTPETAFWCRTANQTVVMKRVTSPRDFALRSVLCAVMS